MKTFGNLLTLIYITILFAMFAIDQTDRADHQLLALVMIFSVFLFAPLILIAVFAAFSRSRTAAVILFAGMALFLAAHPVFPQKSWGVKAAFADEAPQLEAMAFNAGWTVTPPRQLTQTLAQQSADIIVMPEVSQGQIRAYRQELTAVYPHQVFDRGGEGAGLLSRYPIESYEWLEDETGRPILHAVVDFNGRPVHIFTVHLVWPSIRWHDTGVPTGLHEYWQARQIDFVLNEARQIEDPVLIMGDFNMSDQSHAYKILSNEYGDAFRDGGWGLGFTFPNSMYFKGQQLETPVVRIDYIFYSEHFDILGADVDCIPGVSDHCALKATFR